MTAVKLDPEDQSGKSVLDPDPDFDPVLDPDPILAPHPDLDTILPLHDSREA